MATKLLKRNLIYVLHKGNGPSPRLVFAQPKEIVVSVAKGTWRYKKFSPYEEYCNKREFRIGQEVRRSNWGVAGVYDRTDNKQLTAAVSLIKEGMRCNCCD